MTVTQQSNQSDPSNQSAQSDRRRGQIFVTIAAIAWSLAGVMQRELSVSTATQIAGRAVFAGVALTGLVIVNERRNTVRAFRSMGASEFLLAGLMACAMALFIFALNHASVASVLLFQALAPFIAVVMAWFALGERATRRTLAAIAVAVGGVALMAGSPGAGSALGMLASFAMTVAFAGTIVLARKRRDISMVPALVLSQVLVVLTFAAFANPSSITRRDLVFLVLLGFGQMGIGQAFFSMGARLIPATEVAIITLLEVVLGPIWVWLAFREQPGLGVLVGGAIVLGAVVMQATERRSN